MKLELIDEDMNQEVAHLYHIVIILEDVTIPLEDHLQDVENQIVDVSTLDPDLR